VCPGHQKSLVDHPGGDTTGAKLGRGPRLLRDALEVSSVAQRQFDLLLVEADRGPLVEPHLLVTKVTRSRPVSIEQPSMERRVNTAIACELSQHQRATRVRD